MPRRDETSLLLKGDVPAPHATPTERSNSIFGIKEAHNSKNDWMVLRNLAL